MINPNNISDITHTCIRAMGIESRGMEKLIKATFAWRSNLTDLYGFDDYGLMRFEHWRIQWAFDRIRPNELLVKHIEMGSGIDINFMDFDSYRSELKYNIAFMVCVTYATYATMASRIPDDNINDVAEFYFETMEEPIDIDGFTTRYRSIYTSSPV